MSWPLIIGSAMSHASQFGTAAINMQQQDRQNAFNYRMWERNNQYNDPSAQLARLLAAGVPYNTAIQAIAGGTVGQQTSDSPAQSAPYTPMQPISLQDSMAVQSSMDNHDLVQSEVAKNYAEVHDIDPTSPYGKARLQQKLAETVLLSTEAELNNSNIGFNEEKKKEVIANRRLLMQQARVYQQQYKKLFIENKYLDRSLNLSLEKLSAETGTARQECETYMQRINASIQAQIAQARLANAQAEIDEQTLDSIVNKAVYDALISQYSANSAKYQSFVDFMVSFPANEFWHVFANGDKSYATWLGYAKTYAQYEAYRNTSYAAPLPQPAQAVREPGKNKPGLFK